MFESPSLARALFGCNGIVNMEMTLTQDLSSAAKFLVDLKI